MCLPGSNFQPLQGKTLWKILPHPLLAPLIDAHQMENELHKFCIVRTASISPLWWFDGSNALRLVPSSWPRLVLMASPPKISLSFHVTHLPRHFNIIIIIICRWTELIVNGWVSVLPSISTPLKIVWCQLCCCAGRPASLHKHRISTHTHAASVVACNTNKKGRLA